MVFLACRVSCQVTQLDLHRMFHTLGAGVIEEVGVQLDKGFGFTGFHLNPSPCLFDY